LVPGAGPGGLLGRFRNSIRHDGERAFTLGEPRFRVPTFLKGCERWTTKSASLHPLVVSPAIDIPNVQTGLISRLRRSTWANGVSSTRSLGCLAPSPRSPPTPHLTRLRPSNTFIVYWTLAVSRPIWDPRCVPRPEQRWNRMWKRSSGRPNSSDSSVGSF